VATGDEERAMTEETGLPHGLDAMLADTGALMSDCPQDLHSNKLALGIEELTPGLVVLRRMADIQALTRSHAVRQFGGGGSSPRTPSHRRAPRSATPHSPTAKPGSRQSSTGEGFRHVVEDVELPTGTMPAGTNATVWWAAANVDPEAFDDPMDIRLDRTPNPHICFASGWHRCLGSHLARLELRVALDAWHERIPSYRLEGDEPLQYSVNPRAPHHLPLAWDI
jgi:hypothetical protein